MNAIVQSMVQTKNMIEIETNTKYEKENIMKHQIPTDSQTLFMFSSYTK